jgi:hypothetical protein
MFNKIVVVILTELLKKSIMKKLTKKINRYNITKQKEFLKKTKTEADLL